MDSESTTKSNYDTIYYQPYTIESMSIVSDTTIRKQADNFIIAQADSNDTRIFSILSDSMWSKDYLNSVVTYSTITRNSKGQIKEKQTTIGSTATITNNYAYATAGWHYPYKTLSVSTKHIRASITKSDSTRLWFNDSGQLTKAKQFCGTDWELETTLSNFDEYGSPERISKIGERGGNLLFDSISIELDHTSTGRFISATKGELNNNAYYGIDSETGKLIK